MWISILIIPFDIVGMDRTSDTYFLFILKFPYSVDISLPYCYLILHFNKWVFFSKIVNLIIWIWLVLPCSVDWSSFFHKLSDSIDWLIIWWLVIMRCFINCEQIKHVLIISFVNEQLVLILLYDHIPRLQWLWSCHYCCNCNFSCKHICFVFFGESLENRVLQSIYVIGSPCEWSNWQLFIGSCFIHVFIKCMNFSCFHSIIYNYENDLSYYVLSNWGGIGFSLSSRFLLISSIEGQSPLISIDASLNPLFYQGY